MAKRHGRKRFYIVGEGVFGERNDGDVGGGRILRAAAADAAAGADGARFRFSRIARAGKAAEQLNGATRKTLATTMTGGVSVESTIPAGYTYLGQFIDHDLTFDKTGKELGEIESPPTMLQGRSPALDLDSLYGRGPNDTPSFYDPDHLHLKTGTTGPDGPGGRASISRVSAIRRRPHTSPTSETTRTWRSRRRTSRSSGSTTASWTGSSRAALRPPSCFSGRAGRSRATTSG